MTTRSPIVPLWRRQRVRRLALQSVFLGFVAIVVVYLVVQAAGLDDLDLGYLNDPAGFPISTQWLTTYDSSDTRLDAYVAGVVNTGRLVVIGLVLTTILGTLVGVARLSSNWLVARLAASYVETIRNTPLLVQVFFWYFAVFLQLPRIEDRLNLLDGAFISNRGVALPFVDAGGAFGIWLVILALALLAVWYVRRRLQGRELATGRSTHATPIALAVFAVIGAIGFGATGAPLSADIPSVISPSPGILAVEDGLLVTPEFAAILVALVIYTGAFIAEIVRGSIQALPRGQTEAAAAVGLSGYQRMTLIILPQALRIIIPPLTNQYLNLTKNSSLAFAIAYPELLLVSDTIINNAAHAVPMFLIIFGTYLVMSLAISTVMNQFNRRVQLVGATT